MTKYRRDTIGIGINNFIINVIGFITSVLIARTLGPEKQGLVFLVLLIPNVLSQFVSPATQTATSYFINTAKIEKNGVATVVLVLTLTFSIVAGALLAIAYYLGYEFGLKNSFVSISTLVFFSIAYLLLILPRSTMVGLFYALEAYTYSNKINLIYETAVILIVLILSFTHSLSVLSLLYTYMAANILVLLQTFLYFKKIKLFINFSRLKLKWISWFVRYSMPVYYTSIVQSLQQRGNLYFIGIYSTLTSVGLFGISFNLADKLNEVIKPMAVTHLPKVTQEATNDKKSAVLFTQGILNKSLSLYALALPVFFLATYVTIPLLYTKEYNRSISLAWILSLGLVCLGISRILNNVFSALDRQKFNSLCITVSTVFNLTLTIYSLKEGYSIEKIALILTSSYVLNMFLQVITIYLISGEMIKLKPDLKWLYSEFKNICNISRRRTI